MSKFDYLNDIECRKQNGGGPEILRTDITYGLELKEVFDKNDRSLGKKLTATISYASGVPQFLGVSNRMDLQILDQFCLREVLRQVYVVNLFTKDIQADYFFWCFVDRVEVTFGFKIGEKSKDAYILKYKLGDNPEKLNPEDAGDKGFFKVLGFPDHQLDRENGVSVSRYREFNREFSETVDKFSFKRDFVELHDDSRQFFEQVYLIAQPFQEPLNFLLCPSGSQGEDAFRLLAIKLYGQLRTQKPIAGRGQPTVRNLDQLGVAALQVGRKVTIVTGLPGTGKEAYCQALHYSHTAVDLDAKAQLVTSTALDLGDTPELATRRLIKRVESKHRATVFIDELNKCSAAQRSKMLRMLESPEGCFRGYQIRYVLAASDDLDELAIQPPQDFWTRIDSRIEVVHPTGKVNPDDARDFLQAFFYLTWFGEAADWLRSCSPANHKSLQTLVLGRLSKYKPETGDDVLPLEVICQEFVDSLAPVCVRDTVSVRGLVGIVKQVFSRVLWRMRYGGGMTKGSSRPDKESPPDKDSMARAAVNEATQEVLSILNSARNTTRTETA
jgi:hypothetical protein